MRVALYARVSTKDKGQDYENQLIQLRAFAKSQGWDVVSEYVDKASGKRSDREQFQKMFAAASRREFDVLLFWSLDRLYLQGVVERRLRSLATADWLRGQLSLIHRAIPRFDRHLQRGRDRHSRSRGEAGTRPA